GSSSPARPARRGRPTRLREDEWSRRHSRARTDSTARDLRGHLRVRGGCVAPSGGPAPGPRDNRVAEEEADRRAARPPAERVGKNDRLGLLRASQAGSAGLDAAALGRADAGHAASPVHEGAGSGANRQERRSVRARARRATTPGTCGEEARATLVLVSPPVAP